MGERLDEIKAELAELIPEGEAIIFSREGYSVKHVRDLEAALDEAHEQVCGCDLPGDVSVCVGGTPAFAVLAGVTAGEPPPNEQVEERQARIEEVLLRDFPGELGAVDDVRWLAARASVRPKETR